MAYIMDDDNGTNLPPIVNLTNPTNGAVFYTPVDIPLVAIASDVDGSGASVELFAGSNSLGVVTNWVVVEPLPGGGYIPGSRAFILDWSNVPPSGYVLTAVATDNGGASTRSDPVKITVLPGPPPTNIPPLVHIISPANRSGFLAPEAIPIFAYAKDPDRSVDSVVFFAGHDS